MNQPNDELKPKKAINLTFFNFIPEHCSIECMVCKKYMCSCPERQEDGSWKCGPFDTYKENIAYAFGRSTQSAPQGERDEELQTAIGEVFRAALPHASKLSHLFPELSTALYNLEVIGSQTHKG